jgi:hypothetical protein
VGPSSSQLVWSRHPGKGRYVCWEGALNSRRSQRGVAGPSGGCRCGSQPGSRQVGRPGSLLGVTGARPGPHGAVRLGRGSRAIVSPESLGASSDHRSRGQADEYLCPILKEDHRPARRVGVPGEDRVGLFLPVPRKDGLQVASQDDVALIPQWHDARMLLEGHAWISVSSLPVTAQMA